MNQAYKTINFKTETDLAHNLEYKTGMDTPPGEIYEQ